MRRLRFTLTALVALVLFAGYQWYSYISNTVTPYDELGIELNSMMPKPVRKYGCDRLQATFKGSMPPLGCEATPGSKDWM